MCDSLNHFGITNKAIQAGIIAVVSTEGGFHPRAEMSYSKTPNDRLRLIFGNKLSHYDEPGLTALKLNDVAFFDVIYGGQQGNIAVGDGFKYRGRGFNQITFRNNYEMCGRLVRSGADLVTNPDHLLDVAIAADALAIYFMNGFKNHPDTIKNSPVVIDLNTPDATTACLIAFQCNAGWGRDLSQSVYPAEHQRQLVNLPEILNVVNS